MTRDWLKEAKSRTRFSAALLSFCDAMAARMHLRPTEVAANLRVTRADEKGSGEVERGRARFINEWPRHSARSKELHLIARTFPHCAAQLGMKRENCASGMMK